MESDQTTHTNSETNKLLRIIIVLLSILLTGALIVIAIMIYPSRRVTVTDTTDRAKNTTPTPLSTTNPTITPTIDEQPFKTVSIIFDPLLPDWPSHNLSLEIPATAEVEQYPQSGKKTDERINVPIPYATRAEIRETRFTISIGTPHEMEVTQRATVVDLNPTQTYSELYRSPVSKTDPTIWGYATTAKLTGQCQSYYPNSFIDAPCSGNVVLISHSGKEEDDKWLQIFCEAKLQSGLELCDQIVKSIRINPDK